MLNLSRGIAVLREVSIEAVEYFAELIKPGERRSARRDYLLFASGVLASTVVAVIVTLVAG